MSGHINNVIRLFSIIIQAIIQSRLDKINNIFEQWANGLIMVLFVTKQ